MKIQLLCLGAAKKPSPISEGVVEIRINSQPCKGINPTTRHTQARTAPWVVTVDDAVKESCQDLPHPSVVFHAYASVDTPWVAQHYPMYLFLCLWLLNLCDYMLERYENCFGADIRRLSRASLWEFQDEVYEDSDLFFSKQWGTCPLTCLCLWMRTYDRVD
jgi:hypothetical protein